MQQALRHQGGLKVLGSRSVLSRVGLAPGQALVQRHCSTQRKVSCNDSKAKFFVGGNWKANGTLASVATLVKDLNAGTVPPHVDVIVAPPFIYLDTVKSTLDPKYHVAAQNSWIKGGGAFTGEVTADQLKDFGVEWVLAGHSERRTLLGESNEIVAKKTHYALGAGLQVIACIGETLEQRNDGSLWTVLGAQIQALIDEITDWDKVVIAYEPVWAIGTGVVATPDQAQEVHAFLRTYLTDHIGAEATQKLRIIYGGSVNDSNAAELGNKPDIDGFLVGGASLNGAQFGRIVAAAPSVTRAAAAA